MKRTEALALLDRDLRPGGVVELVGVGGVGKTTLVRRWVASREVGSVWWVDLGDARTPDDAIAEVAAAGSLSVAGRMDAGRRLAAALEARSVGLLVLDDVTDPTLVDPRWSGGCPVIVTSRRPLDLVGAHPLHLPPLTPDEARQALVDLVPGWAEDPDVGALATWLDRLPASLVAVAPLAALGSASAVLAHLRRGGAVGGVRSVLRQAWEELAPSHRAVWSRLSVLPGPLDLELATVAAGPVAAAALLELVARGLVVHEEDGLRLLYGAARFGAARLDHPEQVARGVAEWLADDGELPTVTRAPGPMGDLDFATRWRRLFPWAFEAIRVAHPAMAAALVLRWSPWLVHMAPSATSRAWLERGIQAARRGEVALVESVLRFRRVSVLLQAGDLPSVDADLDATDAIAAASDCRWLRSRTGVFRGHVAYVQADLDGASQYLHAAAEHARAAGVRWQQARAESNLAQCRLEADGDAEEVVAQQRSALDLVRDGPSDIRGSVRLKLADALRRAGRLEEALDVVRAAMRDFDGLGAVDTRLVGSTTLGILLVEAGRAPEALEVLRAAACDAEAHGLRTRLAWVASALGHVEQITGDLDAAKQTLQRARVLARQEGLRRVEEQVEYTLAVVCWERGEGEAALLHARTAERSASSDLSGAMMRALVAGVLAWLGRTAEAAPDWAALRAIEWPEEMGRSFRLFEAFQELGHLRELVEVGDLSTAEVVRQQLLARADEPAPTAPDAWVAARILRAAVRDATVGLRPPLRVSADRTLVVTPGDARIDLSRRGPIRRLLDALVGARRDTPGRPLDLDVLFEAGWPGQQAAGTSGHARVYVAVSTLRKLGLAEVLQTVDHGYRLDPEVDLVELPA